MSISFAPNRLRSSAGIAAQAMPPQTPSTIISGRTSGDCHSVARTGMAAPTTAPMVSCPSAPMFQMLARKQTASPAAISTSGVALTTSSSIDHSVVTGSMK